MIHSRLSMLAALSVALLSGCGATHGHHGAHHAGMPGAAPTAAAQVSPSQPMLGSGYQKVAAPGTAKVYFINLKNGDTVSSPVRVQFGLSGMGVAPAGMEKAGTGHHHLLVDVASIDANAPLPADNNHRHFGAGQTETTLDLPPGPHTLQLVLADQNHIPHHPVVLSERITVLVK
jgi:hypothetical protein